VNLLLIEEEQHKVSEHGKRSNNVGIAASRLVFEQACIFSPMISAFDTAPVPSDECEPLFWPIGICRIICPSMREAGFGCGPRSTSIVKRRFLQHVLPKGFMKIRHYGILSPNFSVPLESIREMIGSLHEALRKRLLALKPPQKTSQHPPKSQISRIIPDQRDLCSAVVLTFAPDTSSLSPTISLYAPRLHEP
jgi:hypothetical protein